MEKDRFWYSILALVRWEMECFSIHRRVVRVGGMGLGGLEGGITMQQDSTFVVVITVM